MHARQPLHIPKEIEALQGTEVARERRLVSGVLAKDRKATGEFVACCADWLYPFVRTHLVPRAEFVEDVMQEIVFAAWQALPNFRGDASLRSWVMGIARHKLDDYYRKTFRAIETSEEAEDFPEPAVMPGFEQQLDSAALQHKVQRILSRLPEAHALALIWRYRDEKSAREMAQLTGKTEKAVERLLARARENFRKRWNDAGI